MKFKLDKIRVLNKSKTISVIILCYNQVYMINFTSLYSVLKHFKLQQFNIISFLSKVTPMSSTYIDYLKYRYKSSKLYLNIDIKVVNCIMYLTGWDLILFLISYILLKMVSVTNQFHCHKKAVTYFTKILKWLWYDRTIYS